MPTVLGKKIKLFALPSNKNLALEIAKYLQIELSNYEIKRFSDGEIGVHLLETVRGHDVYVVQSFSKPVNENLVEALIMCDSLKRASAKSITLIAPYFCYSRQDRTNQSREPITAKLIADLFQAAGVTHVVTIDLHSPQIQGFYNIPIDNFFGLPVLCEYLWNKKIENMVIVSPDHGGVVRAREFARVFNTSLVIVDKRRPEPNKCEVVNIIGDVQDKTCVIVDDLIDTGGTIINSAKSLISAGAKDIYVACTHGLLSGGALDLIKKSPIKELIITNTINHVLGDYNERITVLSVGSLIGKGIINMLSDEPLSDLYTFIKPINT